MTNYEKIFLKLFSKLSEFLAKDVEKHIKLCKHYPKLMNLYVKKIESDLENEKISDYLTEEEKKEHMKKIWTRIEKENNS